MERNKFCRPPKPVPSQSKATAVCQKRPPRNSKCSELKDLSTEIKKNNEQPGANLMKNYTLFFETKLLMPVFRKQAWLNGYNQAAKS